MKFPGTAIAALLVFATTVGDGNDRTPSNPDLVSRVSHPPASVTEISYSPVQVGDPAPDFTWVGPDNLTHALHEALAQANVLLVLAPDDAVLQKLESEREDLAQIAVVPIAVLDARSKAAAARARRLGVHFLVVPDATHLIGSQFSQLEPSSGRLLPAWYAVDRKRVVRGAGAEIAGTASWTRIAASALAIPSPDVPLPAAKIR